MSNNDENRNNELTFNILPFDHLAEPITVHISSIYKSGGFRLSERDNEFICPLTGTDPKVALYAYTGPDYPNDSIRISLPASPIPDKKEQTYWSVSFLKKYYTQRLTDHFRAKGIPVQSNLVSDTNVWIKCSSPYRNCTGYRCFTLRIQLKAPDYRPELIVISGEVHSVFSNAVSSSLFSETTAGNFNRVLFRNEIHYYRELPEEARRNPEEVFPCINPDLRRTLRLQPPAPDKSNRYPRYWKEIEDFRQKYLDNEEIEAFLHLHTAWTRVLPKHLQNEKRELLFGKGLHAEPKYGFRLLGPKELIADDVVFFYIMHQDDTPFCLSFHFYLNGNEPAFKGGLNSFLKMKYTTDKTLSIIFKDKENPLKEIKERLDANQSGFDCSKRYVAIYLSPHSKTTTNTRHKTIYYQIKEQLLLRGIVSQTIDVNKSWGCKRETEKIPHDATGSTKAVLNPGFQYYLPNILVAIYAKLGGTPWCLQTDGEEELVIGISAYRSRMLEQKYLGSTFSFTSEGRFTGFHCFKSTQLSELVGSIMVAVRNYCAGNKRAKRLVIHFYKRLSRKELKPIEKALSSLGLSIPVVVLSVNKTFSEDLVGFDLTKNHKMPLSGSYISLSDTQYLLYNNQLVTGNETICEREGFPFPLKIHIQQFLPGTEESTPMAEEEITGLLEQVCRFSQLYWKSVSRQWMPVTLRYPEMLAQIYPHFRYNDLTESGSSSLWFL